LEEIVKLVLTGLISGIVVFFLLLKYFFLSYATEKGKNLATKQDITEITNKVEEVKHQYNLIIEQFKGLHQLRLAALDKRLEAHQKAFSLWRELSSSIMNEKDVMIIALKCEDWWWENCLYLDAEPREAFWSAFRLAPSNYHKLPPEEKKETRKDLDKAFLSIEKAVQLPPINIKLDDFKKEDKGEGAQ
jgi:hypothetical protein